MLDLRGVLPSGLFLRLLWCLGRHENSGHPAFTEISAADWTLRQNRIQDGADDILLDRQYFRKQNAARDCPTCL